MTDDLPSENDPKYSEADSPSSSPIRKQGIGFQLDIGPNLGRLTSTLKDLPPGVRIAGLLLILVPISLAVTAGLPPENQWIGVVVLMVVGLGSLIGAYKYRSQDIEEKRQTRGISDANAECELTIFVHTSNDEANYVNGARVEVLRARRPDSGKTKNNGTWIYKYPARFIAENQEILVRAEKEGVGVGSKSVKLMGQNYPESIELLSYSTQSADSFKVTLEALQSSDQGTAIFHSAEVLSHQDITLLASLLSRSGYADSDARAALLRRIKIPPRSKITGVQSADDFAVNLVSSLVEQKMTDNLRLLCVFLRNHYKSSGYQRDVQYVCDKLSQE